MKLSSGKIIVFTLALLVVVVLYQFASSDPPVVPAPASSQAVPSGAASTLLRSGISEGSETPNSENVSPTFHVDEQTLRQRLAVAPQDTVALMDLARLLQDAHRPLEAAPLYEQYLALRPGNRQAWLDLANTYAASQQWEQAEQATQALLDRFPDDPSAMYNMGAIHANLGDFEAARVWWEKTQAQQVDPDLSLKAMHALLRLDNP